MLINIFPVNWLLKKPKNLSNKPIQKVEFMPVDRLIREDESERIIKALKIFCQPVNIQVVNTFMNLNNI